MFCPTSSLVLWILVWRLKTNKWIKPFARRAHLFSMKCSNFLWSNKLIWSFQQTYPKPISITAFHHQSFLGDLRRGEKIAKLDKVCLLKNWEALFLANKSAQTWTTSWTVVRLRVWFLFFTKDLQHEQTRKELMWVFFLATWYRWYGIQRCGQLSKSNLNHKV